MEYGFGFGFGFGFGLGVGLGLGLGLEGDEQHVGLAVARQARVLLQVPLRLVRRHARRALEAAAWLGWSGVVRVERRGGDRRSWVW